LTGVELVAELVLRAAEDDRVEDEDVGHREEGGETAANLAAEAGSPFGDPEVPVDAVPGWWCGTRPVGHLLRFGHGGTPRCLMICVRMLAGLFPRPTCYRFSPCYGIKVAQVASWKRLPSHVSAMTHEDRQGIHRQKRSPW